jgi:hypothetical protein
MVMYVMALAAAGPFSGIFPATPHKASMSPALAHTFSAAFVCMIDGSTRELGAESEW